MRRPVAARNATTQKRKNNAGIIGQQVYLSCARCNAKGAALLLLGSSRADASQPGLAANGGVPMNNSALGRLVDGRDERTDVPYLGVRVSSALAQSANSTQNLTIAQSPALGLARPFGSGFGISHGKDGGRERHGCSWLCQPRCGAIKPARYAARRWRRTSLPEPSTPWASAG